MPSSLLVAFGSVVAAGIVEAGVDVGRRCRRILSLRMAEITPPVLHITRGVFRGCAYFCVTTAIIPALFFSLLTRPRPRALFPATFCYALCRVSCVCCNLEQIGDSDLKRHLISLCTPKFRILRKASKVKGLCYRGQT